MHTHLFLFGGGPPFYAMGWRGASSADRCGASMPPKLRHRRGGVRLFAKRRAGDDGRRRI